MKNSYEFFKFYSLGSISQYCVLQYVMSYVFSFYMTQLAGKERLLNNYQN